MCEFQLLNRSHLDADANAQVQIIVNGGDWLWSPANIKGANKDAKIYVRRSTTLHNLLFCVHTLCMNYVTSTFLLVSSSVRSKQLLCFVQGQGQKREQKHTTKNFVGFHNHSLYWLCAGRKIIGGHWSRGMRKQANTAESWWARFFRSKLSGARNITKYSQSSFVMLGTLRNAIICFYQREN